MQYYFAPLESITTALYRQLHNKHFGGVMRYYMPFISPTMEQTLTPRQLKEIAPEHNEGVCAVPQILCKNADDFIWCVKELAQMGYAEVNLNLGCPSKTVTTKGKGSGFLSRLEELDAFLDKSYNAFASVQTKVTIKTRLGKTQPEEFFKVLEIYNKYPIPELIIHPRVQSDFYKNHVRVEIFEYAVKNGNMPLCFNGDIVTTADYNNFTTNFAEIDAVMIGRGALADPALFRKIQGGQSATKDEIIDFANALFEGYTQLYQSENNALIRMRELWRYLICLFEDGEEFSQKFRRLKTPTEYRILSNTVFREKELRQNASTGFQY